MNDGFGGNHNPFRGPGPSRGPGESQRSPVEKLAQEMARGHRKAAPSEVSWGDSATAGAGPRRLSKTPESADKSFLTDTFEKFFKVQWTLLPEGFRNDVYRWWGAKADMPAQPGQPAQGNTEAHRELVAIDIVKSIGYVLSPDLFIEKHGEGQVQYLNPNDVKFAKQLCLKHDVPHKYRG